MIATQYTNPWERAGHEHDGASRTPRLVYWLAITTAV
jgi:hypothetical protein